MKQRHNPNKPQNNYGGDYKCKNFDTRHDGQEFCHDEQSLGWNESIVWLKVENGKLRCKGNRHNCMKVRYQWIASLPD